MKVNHKCSILLGVIFALGGVFFLATKFVPKSDHSDREAVYKNTVAIAELDMIDSFIEPSTPEEGNQVAEQLADRALSTPGLLQSTDGRSLPNEQQLRQLVIDRVSLMFNPDYDVYVTQVGELLGRDGHEALQGTMFEDSKLWLVFADTYDYAGVAIETTRATLDLGSVTLGEDLWGGRQTTFGDPGVYGSNRLVEQGSTVFNIGIPVMLPPDNTPTSKIKVLYATLSFVWDPSRNKWIPYRTAVYDPTGTLGALPVLWM